MKTPEYQKILGYQLRVSLSNLKCLWTPNRQAQYLLNTGVIWPLSVDTAVWPNEKDEYLLSQIFYDHDTIPNGLNLFDIHKNNNSFAFNNKKNKPIVVAISFLHDNAEYLIEQHKINLSAIKEKQKYKLLHFIGFDVCNTWLLSGLMNCGIRGPNHEMLRNVFGQSLNRYGLFDDIDKAAHFSIEISKIIPEHAPFFPSGLFVLSLCHEVFLETQNSL